MRQQLGRRHSPFLVQTAVGGDCPDRLKLMKDSFRDPKPIPPDFHAKARRAPNFPREIHGNAQTAVFIRDSLGDESLDPTVRGEEPRSSSSLGGPPASNVARD